MRALHVCVYLSCSCWSLNCSCSFSVWYLSHLSSLVPSYRSNSRSWSNLAHKSHRNKLRNICVPLNYMQRTKARMCTAQQMRHGSAASLFLAAVPGENGQCSQVDPVYTVEKQELALDGSSDQRRRPPCCVSVGEGIPLLQEVPGCHVLEVTKTQKV